MFSDPKSNLEQFGLSPGMVVVDLGVGAGFYAKEAARIVGSEGMVVGIDVQKDLVINLKKMANDEKLENVEAIWGDIEKPGGTKMGDNIADAVIASNVLFQVEDKKAFVAEISRIIKPGGKVLVVDWLDSFGGLGPQPSQVVPSETAESLFAGHGFEVERNLDAGDHHYGFVAKFLNK